jgi:hypothetical protein
MLYVAWNDRWMCAVVWRALGSGTAISWWLVEKEMFSAWGSECAVVVIL